MTQYFALRHYASFPRVMEINLHLYDLNFNAMIVLDIFIGSHISPICR